ncbi:unnamed protein product [Cunninghamella blakesleeana]
MEQFGNFYVLTGYATQNHIIHFTYQEDFMNTPTLLRRNGQPIGVEKVKGVLTVVASNVGRQNCILYSVKIHRREPGANITQSMKRSGPRPGRSFVVFSSDDRSITIPEQVNDQDNNQENNQGNNQENNQGNNQENNQGNN